MPTLNFKGKTFVQNHHLAVKYYQLVPKKKLSLTDKVSLHDNLIIQGDNLKALKALLPTYAGKVKCIYIDPPYNTGNEGWAYNDNVNSPMIKDWLGKVVDKDDLTRHDKWLCMMMPRLQLLRELLSEDGAIFISCDDNEMQRLKVLCDEIFGEDKFIATINWRKVYSPRMDAKTISEDIDFIISYAKSEKTTIKKWTFEQNKKQFNVSDKLTGKQYRRRQWRKEGSNARREDRPNLYYSINMKGGGEVFPIRPDGSEGCWRGSISYFEELKEKGEIEFIQENDTWQIYVKQFYNENASQPPSTFWDSEFAGHNQQAAFEIKEIFEKNIFATPKPTSLVKRIIQLVADKNSIILDSFAGSGTTAHAVLDLNKEDGGNRKFIMVEMEGYADDITAERVRRVIKGVPKSKNFKEGTGGTFSYFELGEPIEMESILHGDNLPSYADLARYLFYTATGEEFTPNQLDEKKNFIGSSKDYEVYLFYQPDVEYLKSTALTLERAKSLGAHNGKRRLVFTPAKYVDTHTLLELRIDYCQLPFEIYKLKG